MKKKVDVVGIIGVIAALIGAAEPILRQWVDDKKMDEEIERKVNEALAKRDKRTES